MSSFPSLFTFLEKVLRNLVLQYFCPFGFYSLFKHACLMAVLFIFKWRLQPALGKLVLQKSLKPIENGVPAAALKILSRFILCSQE